MAKGTLDSKQERDQADDELTPRDGRSEKGAPNLSGQEMVPVLNGGHLFPSPLVAVVVADVLDKRGSSPLTGATLSEVQLILHVPE